MIQKIRPLLIVAVLVGCAAIVMVFSPQPKRQADDRVARMAVDTLTISPAAYAVEIQSYGTVQPRTQSLLAAQVGGQVTRLSANFREGGFFHKGDVLLEIDPRDYQANVKVAEAGVMDARQRLQEESARAEQAVKDWGRLGKGDEPGDLVLRKPQVLAAEARLVSASASLDKARLELERTQVLAPFDGRVLRKLVDLGQVVSRNVQVGEVFATDVVEIRLPVRNHDLAFVDLPEHYIDSAPQIAGPKVDIESTLVVGQHWQGEIVRTESAIDEVARQLHVVAQLDNPFSRDGGKTTPIKIGQYVTARIAGKTLSDAIVIPVRSIYQGSYVYIVQDDVLYRRDIQIAWQNGDQAVIGEGLVDGDQLITTPMGQVISGTPVRVRSSVEEERGIHARVDGATVPAAGVSG